jgi:hypothetical protein
LVNGRLLRQDAAGILPQHLAKAKENCYNFYTSGA